MAVYNVHAGHNRIVPGANGYFSEVTEDRNVKDSLLASLRAAGQTVYDCTDDIGNTQSKNLANIVAKCNAHKVDLDVSIHFNASNGAGKGVEVLCYDTGTKAVAQRICDAVASLGFQNRGVKYRTDLAVLNSTRSPAVLVECCFCDNAVDAGLYQAESMAKAIADGILDRKPENDEGWKKNATGWWWQNADGSYPVNAWKKVYDKWYYFNEGGYMVTGWKKVGNKWYYMNPSGAMLKGWQNIGNMWYYFNESGHMLDAEWLRLNGKWYWLKAGGVMAKNEIVNIGGKYYAFMEDGHMALSSANGELS